MKLSVIAIIIFCLLSILNGFINNRLFHTRYRLMEFGILVSIFALIFFRTLVFSSSDDSLSYLEVSLSLLAFPLAFFLNPAPLSNKEKIIPCLFFVVSTGITIAYSLSVAGMKLLGFLGPGKFWQTFSDMFADPSLPYHVRTIFEQTVGIHPTHASLFLGISILIVVSIFLNKIKRGERKGLYIYAIIFFILFFLQVILASRTPFVGTVISTLVLLFLSMKNKLHAIYGTGIIVVISIILVLFVPTFSERFKEISISDAKVPAKNEENSFNLRAGIYKCSFEVIKKNIFLGVGPGNVQEKLNECYEKLSPEVYKETNYNTHNQFLAYWASMGIAGPILLLMIFIYSFWINFQRKDFLALSVTLLFLVCFMTENLLSRQNGIVPFGLFMSYFFYSNSR